MNKMEIVILSGFLGSGKTTVLVELIKKYSDKKIAILMNELGGFNVDSKIIGEETPYNELLNGCICCDLKSDVEVQLNDLYYRHQPDIVFIEATGVAHPVEIYDACTENTLLKIAHVRNITTIVDCQRFLNRKQYSSTTLRLMEEQIQFAHVLIVNKVDLLSEEEREFVLYELKQLNPKATLVESSFGHFENNILETEGDLIKQHHHQHHGIQSVVYEFKSAVDSRQFVNWLMSLDDHILRVKGFIKFRENKDQTVLFQYSYGIPTYEEEPMNYPLKLVVIGESINKDEILNKLDQLQFS